MISKLKKVLKKPPKEIFRLVVVRLYAWGVHFRQRLFPPDISEGRFLAAVGAPAEWVAAGRFLSESAGAFAELLSAGAPGGDLPPEISAADGDIIDDADRACAHLFDFLGSGPTDLGPVIDWHRDFKSGKTWPKAPVARLDLNDVGGGADVKVSWELSRFQHLVPMGQAYLLTGDEKYPREFMAQIDSWLAGNPVGLGVNWACPMDVAIRAVNWIWALSFFRGAPSVPPEFWVRFFHSLYVHGRFVRSNMEWNLIRHNHYLADLAGLVFVGGLFGWTKTGRRWSAFARRQLEKEMGHQVYEDGVGHEGSVPYHRLAAELFLTSTIVLERTGSKMSPAFRARLQRMLDFIMVYTKPDGEAPLFGDADDGRLQIFSPETAARINDHRYLLAIGAVVFNRADYARAAGGFSEEAWWLLGARGSEAFSALALEPVVSDGSDSRAGEVGPGRSIESAAFPIGGFYFMRSDDLYLAIDCGPVGLRGTGGHGHNDALSLEIQTAGHTFITDSGSYVYGADPEARNRFRSTRAHNVVELDGEEIAELGAGHSLWTIADQARPKCLKWETHETHDIFVGEHYGYRRLPGSPTVRRAIYFDKDERYWVVKDSIDGSGSHSATVRFHFRPGKTVLNERSLLVTAEGPGGGLALAPITGEGVRGRLVEGRFSPSYGVRRRASVLEYHREGPMPWEFITIIMPGGENGFADAARLAQKAKEYLE